MAKIKAGILDDAKKKKQAFIKALAQYLVVGQASKSIYLEMGVPHAKEWAALRSATPLMGYPTVEEAEKILTSFLS